jgi:hypothetical protein
MMHVLKVILGRREKIIVVQNFANSQQEIGYGELETCVTYRTGYQTSGQVAVARIRGQPA